MTALFKLGTLLLAVAILLCGHGLQLTLLPIRADSLGWTTSAIGITASAYFSGFVVGCIAIPGIVGRIGHIRGFMVMGALATLALLGAGLLDNFAAWLVLRFTTVFAFSGLYMVIESWLSEASTRDNRGSVLATYTVICLLGMVLGQGLLGLADPGTLDLFAIGAALLCLARIIHESFASIHNRLASKHMLAGRLRRGASHLCSGLALSGGPVPAGPESKPGGRIVHAS